MLALLLAVCLAHACSDDVAGVLGNETLAWDPSPGATRYEISVGGEICAWVLGSTEYLVSGSPCDRINDGSGFRVRACNAAGCSDWSSESVEILPHACLRADGWECRERAEDGTCIDEGWSQECEEPCYAWSYETPARRLAGVYDPCP